MVLTITVSQIHTDNITDTQIYSFESLLTTTFWNDITSRLSDSSTQFCLLQIYKEHENETYD